MTPSHARKGGVKYRYYVSSALVHRQPERAGALRRIPAAEVEALVLGAVRNHLNDTVPLSDHALILVHRFHETNPMGRIHFS
jgi:site-specific DNA recombinase